MNIRGLNIESITLEDIYDFIESRGDNISPEIAYYMELMEKVYNFDNRPKEYGSKEIILKHLMKIEKLSRHMANKVYEDAMEYFYSQSAISKDAHRNRIADRQERLLNMAIEMVEDVNDIFKLLKANADLAKILNLDKEDTLQLSDDEFLKPFRILSMDAHKLGLPTAVNRKELQEWVETLPELTERERELILQESLVKPLNLFPTEDEDLRKS